VEIDEALTSYLLSYSGLTALIGRRIYSDSAAQSISLTDGPTVVYDLISEETTDTFVQQTTELTGDTFQFSAWATTRKVADSVARQIKKAFKNYSGVMGGESGVTVNAILQISKSKDSTETPKLFRTAYEFQIWYQEV
jgi:hypothetical protein